MFAIEIEDLSNHIADRTADPYHYHLKVAVQIYWDKKGTSSTYYQPYSTLAEGIRWYYEKERGRVHVTPPEGYKTVPIEKIEKQSQPIEQCPKIDKKEYARAMGYEECSDDDAEDNEADDADEDWYESLKNV